VVNGRCDLESGDMSTDMCPSQFTLATNVRRPNLHAIGVVYQCSMGVLTLL